MQKEKLVRDKIPEIIRAIGDTCLERTETHNAKYRSFLLKKLKEETGEFVAADQEHILEELADLHEVLCALAHFSGYSIGEVLRAARIKRRERGAFKKRIIMKIS